jgi:GNAT superfamily N-acetyltransferase
VEDAMKSGCFGCDVMMEGDDAEALADQFVTHAAEKHDRRYPEEALRNYARNYAEAGERLTGSTDRLSEIGDITVHPVTDDRIDDWLNFFDHDGLAGNPDWASCYCLEPHESPSPEMPELLWKDRRAAMIERLRTGGTFGYLAYVDGKPAGWVNASRRSDYTKGLVGNPASGDPSAVGVSCFVIAPPYRRHGVASALLDRVIADGADRGAAAVEGYPRNEPEESDGDGGNFRGPRSIYDARGFETAEVRERDTVVRRPVG